MEGCGPPTARAAASASSRKSSYCAWVQSTCARMPSGESRAKLPWLQAWLPTSNKGSVSTCRTRAAWVRIHLPPINNVAGSFSARKKLIMAAL